MEERQGFPGLGGGQSIHGPFGVGAVLYVGSAPGHSPSAATGHHHRSGPALAKPRRRRSERGPEIPHPSSVEDAGGDHGAPLLEPQPRRVSDLDVGDLQLPGGSPMADEGPGGDPGHGLDLAEDLQVRRPSHRHRPASPGRPRSPSSGPYRPRWCSGDQRPPGVPQRHRRPCGGAQRQACALL